MALECVRETTTNRCVAAFTEAADANAWVTALGAGYGRVNVSDAKQGDDDLTSVLGKVVASDGSLSDYEPTGAALRAQRLNQIKQLVRTAYEQFPQGMAGDPRLNLSIRYLQVGWAAAQVNANLDSATRFGEIEAMLKGGDYAGGIGGFVRAIVTNDTVATTWGESAGLANSLTTVRQPDASGAIADKTATLPSGWNAERYNPRYAFV